MLCRYRPTWCNHIALLLGNSQEGGLITHYGNAKNGPHSGAEALGYELFDSIIHSHNVAQIMTELITRILVTPHIRLVSTEPCIKQCSRAVFVGLLQIA